MKHTFIYGAAIAGLLMALPAAGYAQEINGQSKISSVTVFPSGAEITRVFSVFLPEGQHELVLKDLPSQLEGRSLRIEGVGANGLEIGAIDHKVMTIPFGEQSDQDLRRTLQDKLDQLRDRRVLLQAEIEAAKLQKTLLMEMTKLPSQPVRPGQEGGVGDLSGQYSNLYNLMGDKFVEAERRSLEALVKLRGLDKEIKTVNRQLSEQPAAKRQITRLVVNVLAVKGGNATFQVRYQVRGAGWRPLYEARLDTSDKGSLALVRRAEIFQSTQEDWNNVALRLSTTNPQGRTNAPTLHPWFVDFLPERKPKPPVPVADAMREEMDDRSLKLKRFSGANKKLSAGIMALESPAKPRAVKVSFGSYQMVFEVPDSTSVKRSGERKKVFLDTIRLTPKVGLFTVPKRDQRAYLHAQFDNKTGNPLLSGDLSLFRDGVYVGRSHMKAIEPGQKGDIGFGVDPKVNVKWVRLDRVKGETGLISSSNSDVHRYKITVTNGHEKAMPVTIFDQMPYANQETLQISLLNSNPKPTHTNVKDKKGVMSWELTAKPKQPLVVEFGYQLVWPKGKKISLR